MHRVQAQTALAAASQASVLIVGPPGSGREHVARAIHYGRDGQSPAGEPLVPLDCSLLASELLQSTIAALVRTKTREATAPATLLLNQADQLPPDMQRELPGLLTAAAGRVRVIATSRQPLADLAARGEYHGPLACLLSTIVIELPSLAQRIEELPLLAQFFLEQANCRGGKQLGGFTPEALDRLAGYSWPSNLDELEAVVREAHASAAGPEVTAADLPRRLQWAADAAVQARPEEPAIILDEFLAAIELELIQRALAQAKGNKAKAARLLGLTRPRLYRRLVQLGLEEPPENDQETDSEETEDLRQI
jgi:DNA-binding NtrC family response regulator